MGDYDVVVIGAGVSGLAALKCVLEVGLNAVCYEKTEDIGGLWHFTEDGYGVMRFTHINVSKYNYCFSDFPFPEDCPDNPHNTEMQKYIESYADRFELRKHISFSTTVINVRQNEDNSWTIRTQRDGVESVVRAKNVAVATGHHAKPKMPSFPGQDTFSGEIIHSVAYKDAITNGMRGKKPMVVGVGNSGMDVAVDLFQTAGCKPTILSTRSGAWVFNNHVFGYAADLYANRFFLNLPLWIASPILKTVIKLANGDPYSFGLDPTMGPLQAQPSVSGLLFFHLRRNNIIVKPDVKRISGNEVFFLDGSTAEVDSIVCCTGYKMELPFFDTDLKDRLLDDKTNEVTFYKSVFSPSVGQSLAFIGFVQPASGGILSMSETQARWFAQVCAGKVNLPSKPIMEKDIAKERRQAEQRYFKSTRHTIQRDPIIYNDDVCSQFGARPAFWRHPLLAYRLLLSSGGSAQWRLQGPGKWSGAKKTVKSVPVVPFMAIAFWSLVVLICYMLFAFFF